MISNILGENICNVFNRQMINVQNIKKCSFISKRKDKQTHRKKCTKDLKRQFPEEKSQMANKHMKRCSTTVVIRKMHMKKTVRQFSLIRMPKLKKMDNINLSKYEEIDAFFLCWQE